MSHDLSAHFAVSDARDVVWAHAVNSRSDLEAALRDTRVHMLEADLMLAAAPRDDGAVEPAVPTASDVLMCHPPLRSSDLTFDGFAREVLAAVRRGRVLGIKLDFKEADAVAPCLELLRLSGLASDDADAADDTVRAVPASTLARPSSSSNSSSSVSTGLSEATSGSSESDAASAVATSFA